MKWIDIFLNNVTNTDYISKNIILRDIDSYKLMIYFKYSMETEYVRTTH